jgi:Na+:H+ antiporter, NhaA family
MHDSAPPTRASGSLARVLLRPLQRFLQVEAASGIVLLAATAIALIWASSPWSQTYHALWHAPLRLGSELLSQPLHFWVNDALMIVFFLVVGLEVRREMHEGALSTLRLATLPIVAALGGVLIPALIFVCINPDPVLRNAWAVPTATDIAFAIGVLALLGRRIPAALRILLLAIAIIDDILAILIIALFYSSGIRMAGLLIAAAAIALVLVMQRLRIRSAFAYVVPGAIMWAGMLYAGIHPTLAGVILGLLTPATPIGDEASAPLARVENALHPWVAYAIIPIFALANAGVDLRGAADALTTSATLVWGVVIGLVLGKPLGIALMTWLCLKLRLGDLPSGVGAPGVLVVGALAGIGFTMAIFIANLAFSDAALLSATKLAILIASFGAALLGIALGVMLLRTQPDD